MSLSAPDVLLKTRNGLFLSQALGDSGGMPSGCNLCLVHLRIYTLSVVGLGGLNRRMHGAHYPVFSGVEEEK